MKEVIMLWEGKVLTVSFSLNYLTKRIFEETFLKIRKYIYIELRESLSRQKLEACRNVEEVTEWLKKSQNNKSFI